MSSRVKSKEEARARAAKIRAAKAQAARRRNIMVATSAIAVVIVIVGGLVLAKVLTGDDSGTTSAANPTPSSSALSASVLADVTSLPASTFDEVGAEGVTTAPAKITARPLTADGKPEVLYIGAEYCPYCAAERWPMTVALSRFGTWSGLGAAESSAKDVFPSTQTLSYHGAEL